MQGILELLKSMPAYAKYLFENHTIIAVIAAVVFFFVLFFSNKVVKFFRTLFVIAILAMGAIAYITKRWPMLCLAVLVLIILIIIRLIKYIFTTIRTNRRNRRIEERALEKSAKRRGSWKNKQGYSGERKPIEEPEYKPEKMAKEEIDDVLENETVSEPATAELKPEAAKTVETAAEETKEKAEPGTK